ncbi:MAG: ABC transporter ATP-binding protein [Coriobacteriia bacterium]|nr:ABC transporter ATP-binding protein [Coriobacteriia bacterium]
MGLTYLFRRVWSEQPFRFSGAVLMAGLAGILEGLALAAVVPMLQLVQSGGQVAQPTGRTGAVIAFALSILHLQFTLVAMLGFILLLLVGSQVVTLMQQRFVSGSVARFEANLRNRLYSAVTRADWQFFVSHKSADVSTGIVFECMRASSGYLQMVMMLGTIITVLVYLGLALALSWQMTLVIAIAGGLLVGLLRGRVQRGSRYGEAMSHEIGILGAEAIEHVAAAKTVKAYSVEELTIDRFAGMAHRLANLQFRNLMNQAWLRFFFESISAVAITLGIYFAVVKFNMPMASLIVFLLIFYRISPRISNIQANQSGALSQVSALVTVDTLTDDALKCVERGGNLAAPKLKHALALESVEFGYGAEKPVLHGVSLEIPAGRTVAIVGPSGSGKTTIVDLILGLIRPTAGRVSVDGHALSDLDVGSWRRRIGYVAQDSSFFHASVRENIRFGAADATDEEIARAAKLAFADGFIAELPEGYDTIIGDRGVRLSGGQRQRLALARAIVRNPDVLVLDEATSALDAGSEEKIQQAVDSLAETMTIVIVTHRLATVRGADHIFVLESGEVVESGSWDVLVASGGRFAQLQSMQSLS